MLKSVLLGSNLLKQVMFISAKPSRMLIINCNNINVNNQGLQETFTEMTVFSN